VDMKSSFSLVLCFLTLPNFTFQQEGSRVEETFKTELFLNKNDLNSGLYEGEVKGRRRFGETQKPHGIGSIFYFSNDKYNRVNYTGQWVNGDREGNGTTSFRDGAVYRGEYRSGLEHGRGFITYPNGNSLDAEFVAGKIMGHGVFRYASGDQREGFFLDNILDGQVIFTKGDGTTIIEQWVKGEKVETDDVTNADAITSSVIVDETDVEDNRIDDDDDDTLLDIASIVARGGNRRNNVWGSVQKKVPSARLVSTDASQQSQIARSRARSFLFDIYSNVN